jgi:hypothetical protein
MLLQLSYFFQCDMHEVARLLARLSAPRKYSMQGSILSWEKKNKKTKAVQKAAKVKGHDSHHSREEQSKNNITRIFQCGVREIAKLLARLSAVRKVQCFRFLTRHLYWGDCATGYSDGDKRRGLREN